MADTSGYFICLLYIASVRDNVNVVTFIVQGTLHYVKLLERIMITS
jgi:hypothetical protein